LKKLSRCTEDGAALLFRRQALEGAMLELFN
jgi:hypothetical protein